MMLRLPVLFVTALCAAACSDRSPPASAAGDRHLELEVDAMRRDLGELLQQTAALRRESRRLHDDIRSLRAEVAGLRIESMRTATVEDAEIETVSPMVRVNIHTQPGGADVYLGGAHIGQTPLSLAEPIGNELVLEIRKPGFRTQHRKLHARADTTMSVQLAPE